jgi:DNA-binding NtrC family response regulator
VVLLAQRLLRTIAAEVGRPGLRLSPGAEAALEALPWPGNVRQLRNVLEHAAFMSERDVLEPGDVGGGALERSNARPAPAPGATTLAEAERRHIEATLEAQEWNVRTSAAALGLSRTALYDRIKKHGIRLPGAGPAARGPR